jgi:hypothetical protein
METYLKILAYHQESELQNDPCHFFEIYSIFLCNFIEFTRARAIHWVIVDLLVSN